jgi:hypothetical protein
VRRKTCEYHSKTSHDPKAVAHARRPPSGGSDSEQSVGQSEDCLRPSSSRTSNFSFIVSSLRNSVCAIAAIEWNDGWVMRCALADASIRDYKDSINCDPVRVPCNLTLKGLYLIRGALHHRQALTSPWRRSQSMRSGIHRVLQGLSLILDTWQDYDSCPVWGFEVRLPTVRPVRPTTDPKKIRCNICPVIRLTWWLAALGANADNLLKKNNEEYVNTEARKSTHWIPQGNTRACYISKIFLGARSPASPQYVSISIFPALESFVGNSYS